MKPCPPGGRKPPPPVVVTRGLPQGPTGGDWGRETPVYPDVAWTKKPVPPIPPRKEPKVSKPLPVVVIATDGSVGHAPGVGMGAGWAWVSEHGKADAGAIKSGDARVAELAAIAAACAAPEHARNPLRILCDSKAAIRVAEDIIAGHPTEGVSKHHTEPISKRASTTGLTIEWVRGHNGHQLNEIADRLALMARRRHQARLGSVHEIAKLIARRELRDAS